MERIIMEDARDGRGDGPRTYKPALVISDDGSEQQFEEIRSRDARYAFDEDESKASSETTGASNAEQFEEPMQSAASSVALRRGRFDGARRLPSGWAHAAVDVNGAVAAATLVKADGADTTMLVAEGAESRVAWDGVAGVAVLGYGAVLDVVAISGQLHATLPPTTAVRLGVLEKLACGDATVAEGTNVVAVTRLRGDIGRRMAALAASFVDNLGVFVAKNQTFTKKGYNLFLPPDRGIEEAATAVPVLRRPDLTGSGPWLNQYKPLFDNTNPVLEIGRQVRDCRRGRKGRA